MMSLKIVWLSTLALCVLAPALIASEDEDFSSLSRILSSYDTLHHDSFQHLRAKRDLYSGRANERQVEYDTLGRHFKLVLRPDTSVLAPNFRIVAVDGQNKQRVVDVDLNMYHGYLDGERGTSSVNAYWDEDNTLTASIRTTDDVYIIEPSWRHLPNSPNYTMISYRGSDMNMTRDLGKNYCGFIKVHSDEELKEKEEGEEEEEEKTNIYDERRKLTNLLNETSAGKERARRDTGHVCSKEGKTACSLLLVADYKFYDSVGSKDVAKTSRYLIGQMDYIDSIYKTQEFGSCRKMGFVIQEIRIHETASVSPIPTNMRFNQEKSDWDTTELLQAFSADTSYKSFCLAHLFTHIAFDNGVLGLAYIGSSRPYSVGGICSPSYYKAGEQLYLNTGWSSSLNRYHRKLLTEELRLVTAHELGHNWGSEHDPDTEECSPSAASGGKYIMYTYSVSGMDVNNKIFSPCSRRAMGNVVTAKADSCFTKPTMGFCGNSRVEPDAGEECDAGPIDVDKPADPCCDEKCKFRPGVRCSDANSVCCDRCQFASSSRICYTEQELLCEAETHCNGMMAECPRPNPKPDGAKCLNSGHCRGGTCLSLCEYNDMLSCVSDDVATSCKWSCKENQVNSNCTPFSDGSMTSLDLPDGMPCVQGYCDKGQCLKQVNDRIQRLWSIIENISVDQLVMFMRANIVGTVIILSLFIWIPASIAVECYDRKIYCFKNAKRAPESMKFDSLPDNVKKCSEPKRRPDRSF